jgi:hypothetical protein
VKLLVTRGLIVLLVSLLLGLGAIKNSEEHPNRRRTPTFAVSMVTKATRTSTPTRTQTPTVTSTETPTITPSETLTPDGTLTDTPTITITPTVTETFTPTITHEPTNTGTPFESVTPFPNALLCEDSGESHDNSKFHTLWDEVRGCHYDHEHGQTPFTQEVANLFSDFNLKTLLGEVEIGHTNPSSPMENTHKHGGFKWQVDLDAPAECATGFEGSTIAVDAYAIQYHAFGQQSIEFEARNHSTAALLRQCKPGNPEDKGYIYVVQLQEYGQRVSPYQGTTLPYPNNPEPSYSSASGPYFTTDCLGTDIVGCRSDLTYVRSRNLNTNSIWTSKPTGLNILTRPTTSKLFRLLFRVRDTYQLLDSSDLVYPFTWRFVCGDGTYNPANCRWNNTTTTIHEIAGEIPSIWDGLAGFDTDPRVGRVSGEGFVTSFGTMNLECMEVGLNCYPIKLISAFVGNYGSEISIVKVSNPTPLDTPERDIYFCNGVPCTETSSGSQPSGWVGLEN